MFLVVNKGGFGFGTLLSVLCCVLSGKSEVWTLLLTLFVCFEHLLEVLYHQLCPEQVWFCVLNLLSEEFEGCNFVLSVVCLNSRGRQVLYHQLHPFLSSASSISSGGVPQLVSQKWPQATISLGSVLSGEDLSKTSSSLVNICSRKVFFVQNK